MKKYKALFVSQVPTYPSFWHHVEAISKDDALDTFQQLAMLWNGVFEQIHDASLKMYVWENVLYDCTPGMACALAESPEEAKALLIRDRHTPESCWDGVFLDGVAPKEVSTPACFAVWGGG